MVCGEWVRLVRPGLIHQVSHGEGDPRLQFAERSSCYLEERRRKIEPFVTERLVALQNMPCQVAGAEAKFQDVGIVGRELVDLGQDHIEQGQPRR